MQNKKPENVSNKTVILICGILAAVIMLGSFVVALTKFTDTTDEVIESSEVSEESSEAVSEEISEISISNDEYDYYSKLQFERKPFSNASVADGTLAIINEGTKTFPTIDQSQIVNIGLVKTESVYGLSNMSLVMYEEAILNIDNFIVSFYEQVPKNGLIISKGYTSSDAVTLSEPTVDLATGYSVQFSIYKSSYKFSDSEFSYLREQAYRFGVIQRYPNEKDNYTGHKSDNTVYRYVGLPHRMYMNHYMLSLEEYIDRIRTYQVIEYESELEKDTVYVIYYVPVDDSTGTTYVDVPVGEQYSYTVSGDGDKGFVVTVKMNA